MRTLITLALLAITTFASAQPGHHRDNDRDKRNHHNKHRKHDYKKGRKYAKKEHRKNYNYRVQRELSRYDFLRLSREQRNRLQISLNFMINNNFSQDAYERRLRSDLYNILNKNQYRDWENRAYRKSGNTFIFNFNS